MSELKTIGQLKELISEIPDYFKIQLRINKDELFDCETIEGINFDDIGYSDEKVIFSVEDIRQPDPEIKRLYDSENLQCFDYSILEEAPGDDLTDVRIKDFQRAIKNHCEGENGKKY